MARSLAAAGAVALGIATWLSAPLHAPDGEEGTRALRLVLLDASASVQRRRPGWEAWARAALAREVAAADAAGEDLLALRFARDVERLFEDDDPGRAVRALEHRTLLVAGPAALASDLFAALAAASVLSEGRVLARLRLIADRTYTGRDPELALRVLEARGVEREWVAPPPPELPDLALTGLDAAAEVEPGAPLAVRAWVAGHAGAGGGVLPYELEVDLELPGGRRSWSVAGELPAGRAAPVPMTLQLGPAQRGRTRVALRVVLTAGPGRGDAVPENDRALCEVRAGDDARVLVLAAPQEAAGADAWASSLRTLAGLDVRRSEPDQLAAELPDADVLATFDVDPRSLPAAALGDHLRRGGGWLALAGLRTLSGWEGAPEVSALAPLDLAADDADPRDVVILLDASGSMTGAPTRQARRAARELAAAAPPGERVVLRWFTDELADEIEVRGDQRSLLPTREPGGATDVPAALASLGGHYAELERGALALLVTDGRDQIAGDETLVALRERLRLARVELAVFAVGDGADRAFLARLAGARGRLVEVLAPGALAELFLREAAAGRMRTEGPYPVAFGDQARAALCAAAASPPALGGRTLPPLDGYLRARARPGACVAWTAEDGEPVLGLVRGGLGLAAMLTSLPAAQPGGWAPAWVDAPQLLGPLLRELGRGRPEPSPRIVLADGQLRIEDAPASWPARVRAELVDASVARSAGLGLPDDALGDPRDRRVGPWPWEAPRGGFVAVDDPASAEGSHLAVLALPPTPGEELAWVARAAALEGPAGASVRAGSASPPARAPHPLRVPVLALGLALVAAAGLAWGRR